MLTGSTNLIAMPLVADSLAGRLAVIHLLPFAQAELAGTPGDLLDRLFDGGGLPSAANPVVGDDLMQRVLCGGYPEALGRTSASRRQAWLQDYVALMPATTPLPTQPQPPRRTFSVRAMPARPVLQIPPAQAQQIQQPR